MHTPTQAGRVGASFAGLCAVILIVFQPLAAAVFSFAEAGANLSQWQNNIGTGLGRVTAVSPGLVLNNPATGGASAANAAENIDIRSIALLAPHGDVEIAFSPRFKTGWNHATAQLRVGLGTQLALGISAYGDRTSIYFNGVETVLPNATTKGPAAFFAGSRLSIRYSAADRRLVVSQIGGSYRPEGSSGGSTVTAPAGVIIIHDQVMTAPLVTGSDYFIRVLAQSQYNGGLDTGYVYNLTVNSDAQLFTDFTKDKTRWVNAGSTDSLSRVDVTGSSPSSVLSFGNASGSEPLDDIKIRNVRRFAGSGRLEFSFDNFRHQTGYNNSSRVSAFNAGLVARGLTLLGLQLTGDGTDSQLLYDNVQIPLPNRPISKNGGVALRVTYDASTRLVQVIQSAGDYLNSSNVATTASASGTILYSGTQAAALDFGIGANLQLGASTRYNGGYSGASTLGNMHLAAVASDPGAATSWAGPALRGVNVGTWLAPANFTQLKGWGTKLLRVQLVGSTYVPVNVNGEWTLSAGAFGALDGFLDLAHSSGMKVVIDLHNRYEFYPSNRSIAGWQDTANLDKLKSFWRSLARRYKDDRTVIVGYELLNEPDPLDGTPSDIAAGAAAWNNIAYVTSSEIREIDRYHSIVIDTIGFASPGFLDRLDHDTLSQINGLVYSVHMYGPHEFTEQGTRPEWPFGANGVSGWKYPGTIALGYTTNPALKTNAYVDASYLAANLSQLVAFKSQNPSARLFIGEFGAIRWAPLNDAAQDSTWQYIKDCMRIFGNAGQNWDWTLHEYNASAVDAYTGLNHDNVRDSTTLYSDTNKLRLYKHYVNPANDAVAAPPYDASLPTVDDNSGSYAAWTSAIEWSEADAAPDADPNSDGVNNLLAYALDLSPLAGTAAPDLPSAGVDTVMTGGPWSTFSYRCRSSALDLTYRVQTSGDLVTWTDVHIDGVNAVAEIPNANPDGDGSAILRRVRVKFTPGESRRFYRLRVIR